jgi:DDE superfamily endonuclease
VTTKMLVIECQKYDPTYGGGSVSDDAMRQRILRLANSWNFSWRRKTHKAQLTRHSLTVINEFRAYVNWKIKLLNVQPAHVYNADQTNVFFSMESNFTWAERGARTVSIKGADSSSRLTAMLCANMAGGKVDPFLIFKGSVKKSGHLIKQLNRMERGEIERDGFPLGVKYSVQPKAWMDGSKMLEWIDRVWTPHIQQQNPNGVTYLILDECRSHMTKEVKEAFQACNTEVDFVPGGYTSKCQPMDVGINKPFKNGVTLAFNSWLVGTGKTKPRRQDVSNWIDTSWKSISISTIENSFRHCGIKHSNNEDEDSEAESMRSDDDPLE